jgi:uracil-DNA glycosylase
MPQLRAILALGTIAHQAVLEALGWPRGRFPFAHGRLHWLPDNTLLADSYHCSRLNTNTGRLTVAMFESVFTSLARRLDQPPESPDLRPVPGPGEMGGAT